MRHDLNCGYEEAADTEGYEPILLPEEAMAILGLSRNTFYALANKGEIPGAFRLGKQWRVKRDALL